MATDNWSKHSGLVKSHPALGGSPSSVPTPLLKPVQPPWLNSGPMFNDLDRPHLYRDSKQISTNQHSWTSRGQSVGEVQSLCHDSVNNPTQRSCCTPEMEIALLRRTTEELRKSLSNYLARWSSELSGLRTSLRDEVFRTLELFRTELNRTLCSGGAKSISRSPLSCAHISADMFPKFRTMFEQFIIGQGEVTLDISVPIDNLLMQLLIDVSCQSNSRSSGNTLEDFNQEIRCHEYCQARLNLILDTLMSGSDQSVLTRRIRHSNRTFRRLSGQQLRRMRRSVNETQDTSDQDGKALDLDQYKLLYTPELLFTIRLNRILMQALELGESLIDGLKYFNAAQGICMRKLMRMHHCALCVGLTLTRPCPELCVTVISGCLQPLSELHSSWKHFTDATKVVANAFLEKPQLGLIVQLKQLPSRLLAYFRHLLETHRDWLQPQCSGTNKLLQLINPENLKKMQTTEQIARDPNLLLPQRNLLKQLNLKMDQIADIWTRTSSALCSESPYLAVASNDVNECWNGTTKGRFQFEQCDFCDNHKTAAASSSRRQEQSGLRNRGGSQGNNLFQPGRKQRTSHGTNNQPSDLPSSGKLSPESLASAAYLFGNPAWYPPVRQEEELATRRANEILVRASRDLQWSTDTLLGEVQAYNSITSRLDPQKGENGPRSSKTNPEDPNSSLGLLAYGSMLGWNAPDFAGPRDPTQSGHSAQIILDQKDASATGPLGSYVGRTSANASNPGQFQENGEGSGMDPAWAAYGWPRMQPQSSTEKPAQLPIQSQNIPGLQDQDQQPLYEGSGFGPGNQPIQPYLQYADYPHLNAFHNFVSPLSSETDAGTTDVVHPDKGVGLKDDEDYGESNEVDTGRWMQEYQNSHVQPNATADHVQTQNKTHTSRENVEAATPPGSKENTSPQLKAPTHGVLTGLCISVILISRISFVAGY
ncbi:unnamed protein product [Calicophoron daubneyi]|uniref:Glypican n=1 Tax=Calicophoron daubneyi TaxID=300641 RepID=A0AAV2TX29_CALDB